jgi:divalent metal cation (Fe/Co/Zn/Cd) transporter
MVDADGSAVAGQLEVYDWSGYRQAFGETSDITTLTGFSGASLSADIERELRTAVESHGGIVHLDDFRTMVIRTGKVLVTADVSFDPTLVTGGMDEDIKQIEQAPIGIDSRVKLVYIEPEL